MSESLIFHQDSPLNAETTLQVLCQHLITPIEHAFHRNHGELLSQEAVPKRINFSCTAKLPFAVANRTFELDDFAEKETLVAVLECAGNRRSGMSLGGAKPEGLQWGPGTICNVEWQGTPLRSILVKLLPAEAIASTEWARNLYLHIISAQSDDQGAFAASLPLNEILSHDCPALLAHAANGAPLPHPHGPRAVLPGKIGARWVKWVSELRISNLPSDAEPMKEDYKIILPPHGDVQAADEQREKLLSAAEPIMRLGVGSAIASPNDGDRVTSDIVARGYAVPTGGRPINRVEMLAVPDDATSTIEGIRDAAAARPASEWQQCDSETSPAAPRELGGATWGWTLWSAALLLPAQSADHTFALVVRASTDAEGQEKTSAFNLRGFGNRSWPVVRGLELLRNAA
ncbi:Sulfite oxidase, molybdopterin-binding component [Ceraceosorus bombacis]|uniref:Sulfite oxidase, molybdopterin-binding component n=1 Tax=Ceraceosorus bombacis TaxID=401625 RepID=A0A0P1BFE6_9BASI|nr:Sulfite oxidase, molybdopterin-binding component [Ceraceosorus bombacis]